MENVNAITMKMLRKKVKCSNYCINIFSVSGKRRNNGCAIKKNQKNGDDGGDSENASAMEFKKSFRKHRKEGKTNENNC